MMKKKLLSAILSLTVISLIGTNSAALVYNKENPEVGDGVYDGYDLDCERLTYIYSGGNAVCWQPCKDDNGYWYLKYYPLDSENDQEFEFLNRTIKVPDSINGKTMCYILGSSGIKGFDLNPENPYMECIDNVIFSEDKTKLMSYAILDERTDYIIPDGTKIIGDHSFAWGENLKKVTIPDSVKIIEPYAFAGCNIEQYKLSDNVEVLSQGCFCNNNNLVQINISKKSKLKEIQSVAISDETKLEELYLPSFNIKIDKMAFGSTYKKTLKTQLKSYVQPQITVSENKMSWEKIPNASYYEIYQKLNSGEYKLLKTTKATACKFTTLKSGKNYTFAVKPVAVIPAANFDKEKDEGHYPETFTIEGTMSEDIVLTGK